MKKQFSTLAAGVLIVLFFAAACNRDAGIPAGNDNGNTPASRTASTNAVTDNAVVGLAKITILTNGDAEYLFNERAAPYVVKAENPSYSVILSVANNAFAKKQPVKLTSQTPGEITRLETPTSSELAAYAEWMRGNIVNPEPVRPVPPTPDTLTFNDAVWQDWKVFRLCTKTIPSYTKAKEIFDFCKQQTCVVGPTQIQPCIPFLYVRDGCFARAHKMRYIIETLYGYCSEKVFSFGNLNVQATLSGGCCVAWWYHVAPIVRVKTFWGTRLYVIDPGMFTTPVLLTTWLNAQANTNCNANASVTTYSIQPSSAYTPNGWPPNNTYTTDPNYTLTNQHLLFYGGLGHTCD